VLFEAPHQPARTLNAVPGVSKCAVRFLVSNSSAGVYVSGRCFFNGQSWGLFAFVELLSRKRISNDSKLCQSTSREAGVGWARWERAAAATN
jgi:hypothetical protein